ncbi:unnamed protein product [Ambrosiozyma monospora]|uniref:Unnamed protein product n=1 Tax=Ambrosiozyma monospora TaxID=43982 RepID=A0ACB5SX57_AMBMO|nr:unnamed protein product [Ambrosiozyma monospora]
MKHLLIGYDFKTADVENALSFIKSFQEVAVQGIPRTFGNFQLSYFRNVTSLQLSPNDLHLLLQRLGGCFEKLPRLVSLELRVTMDPIEIRLMKDIVQKWRILRSGKHASLKLSISISNRNEEKLYEYYTDLENTISNNRNILNIKTSILITESPSPTASGIFSTLANLSDSTRIENFTSDAVGWVNNICSLEHLTNICCPSKLCLRMKTLCLLVGSLDASLFDTLPGTLQSLDLQMHSSYDIPSIKIPLSLRKLTVFARKVPEILNKKELTDLTEANIEFVKKPPHLPPEDWPPYDAFEVIQESIDNLPSCTIKLKLTNTQFHETRKQLSFRNLPQLEDLEMNYGCLDHSVSLLPLKKLCVSAHAISGLLPNTLMSLDLDSRWWDLDTDVPSFFQNVILPLNNLKGLRFCIGNIESPVVADDDDTFSRRVRSSGICNSLESLNINFENVALSTFWQSFISPLQNLSELTLALEYHADLVVNDWPPQLHFLTVDFNCADRYSDEDEDENYSRLELGGISKSSLKLVKIAGSGNITIKEGSTDVDQCIILSYDKKPGAQFRKSIDKIGFESIDYSNIDKVLIKGNWRFYD